MLGLNRAWRSRGSAGNRSGLRNASMTTEERPSTAPAKPCVRRWLFLALVFLAVLVADGGSPDAGGRRRSEIYERMPDRSAVSERQNEILREEFNLARPQALNPGEPSALDWAKVWQHHADTKVRVQPPKEPFSLRDALP